LYHCLFQSWYVWKISKKKIQFPWQLIFNNIKCVIFYNIKHAIFDIIKYLIFDGYKCFLFSHYNVTQTHNKLSYKSTGQWFSQGTLVSSTNKTNRHDITKILLKVALNTIKRTKHQICLHSATAMDSKYTYYVTLISLHSAIYIN
jgi:hypothetical protein